MSHYFSTVSPIAYEGPTSDNPLSFKWYDKDRIVLGKRMEEQLRFAVCYWHSFCWNGLDPFGGDTFQRPWQHMADPMAAAKAKAAVDTYSATGLPAYAFPKEREFFVELRLSAQAALLRQQRTQATIQGEPHVAH